MYCSLTDLNRAHMSLYTAHISIKRPQRTFMNSNLTKGRISKSICIYIYKIYIIIPYYLLACSFTWKGEFKIWKKACALKQAPLKAASALQQWNNSWPTKLENERLYILYSSLLPVYIIPTVFHQGAWMKSFHQPSVENLFSSLKLNTVAQHAHRCSTFTKHCATEHTWLPDCKI